MPVRSELEPQTLTRYCSRFAELAIQMGFIDHSQLNQAVQRQREDAATGRPHRSIGGVLFQAGAMTPEQIEVVLRAVFHDAEGGRCPPSRDKET